MVDLNHWDNLSKIVTLRTYSRPKGDGKESWKDICDRAILGNVRGHDVKEAEINALRQFTYERKATPGGRGLWFSGTDAHEDLGGVALNNCWFVTADEWQNFVTAQDLLMLGGGVGMSVEHKFVSRLPHVKKGVEIVHKSTRDADFIVPDSRPGWNQLLYRTLEAFFVTGKGFSYSTVCLRGKDEIIKGFGGKASGPQPLIKFITKICELLQARAGTHVRPLDALDLICCTGEMVVSGNVRRSAILILGDSWDRHYLTAKRWDLKPVPSQRGFANLSVNCSHFDDLHPSFWKTYEHGEPYGIVNVKNMRKYGRMGERKPDNCRGVNPCVPAGTEILTREGYEPIDNLVGETVQVWNGVEWSNVRPRVTGHNQPLVKVTLSCGRTLTCTEAHRFVVREGYSCRGTVYRKSAIQLEPGDKLEKFAYPVVDGGTTFQYAYGQGFYEGDGNRGRKRTLRLYAGKAKLHRYLGEVRRVEDKFTTVLLPFKPFGKGFVPAGWDVNSRLAWIAGLIDSDGCVTPDGGVQISACNRGMLVRTQKLLTTLGCNSKVVDLYPTARKRLLPDGRGGEKEYECKPCYRLLIGAWQVRQLVDLGMETYRVDTDVSPNRDASRFSQVVSVEPAGVADVVYCFTEHMNHTGCFEGVVTGQCGEATLENGEPCNLQEIYLPRLTDVAEFEKAARLMHRWGKRVCLEHYHHERSGAVITENARIGTGITGCLQSELFDPDILDHVYAAIQDENKKSSREYRMAESIRTTVVKPSGTLSLVGDVSPGIHPTFAPYYIRRVRFASSDPLIEELRKAGHHIEHALTIDGGTDPNTSVVDFYKETPKGTPTAQEFDTWQQLDTLMMAQRHWADQAVSVTVYYGREEIPRIKEWIADNLDNLKTISFLCRNDHGFAQAPLEAITEKEYHDNMKKIKPIEACDGFDMIDGLECEGGSCPTR